MKNEKVNLISGGTLERLGLGKITPLIKSDLEKTDGVKKIIAEEVTKIVDRIDGQTINASSSLPPLGDFQKPSSSQTPLSTNRLAGLLRAFGEITATLERTDAENNLSELRKIYGALNMLHGTFNNYTQFNKRASSSIFNNLRM